MPRQRPHVCHKCGKEYTGWRCPMCYKRKKHRAGGTGRSGGRRGAAYRMQSILANGINGHSITDADDSGTADDPD
jgi:hypothetical protein